MSIEIAVKISKSPVPIIWLDTSVINYMTKSKFQIGGNPEKTTIERVKRLYDQIRDCTQKGKLICPLSEQSDEVWCERDKWMELANSLSLGITTAAEDTIESGQFQRFLKAYMNNETEIDLSYSDAFLEDPVDELKDVLKSSIFITVDHGILFGADFHKSKKNLLLSQLNQLREELVRKKVSFRDQLRNEYKGKFEALKILASEGPSGTTTNEFEELNATFGFIGLSRELKYLERYSGKPWDLNGLEAFYESKYYQSMPFVLLHSNTLAYLITKNDPIKPGDSMDAKHIAMLLPYSDIFITDRKMRNFIKKQGFDKLYNTTVCYIGDTEIIDAFFCTL